MPVIELTPAQSQALDERGIVQGPEFILMRPAAFRELLGFQSDDQLRQALQPAWDEAERGELTEWNVNEFLARMHASDGRKAESEGSQVDPCGN